MLLHWTTRTMIWGWPDNTLFKSMLIWQSCILYYVWWEAIKLFWIWIWIQLTHIFSLGQEYFASEVFFSISVYVSCLCFSLCETLVSCWPRLALKMPTSSLKTTLIPVSGMLAINCIMSDSISERWNRFGSFDISICVWPWWIDHLNLYLPR